MDKNVPVTVLLIVAVVLLGLYAAGVVGGDNAEEVRGKTYGSGGLEYDGGLKDGLFDGSGHLIIPGVGVYTGRFAGGRFDGHGVFRFEDGSEFAGNFVAGTADGEGAYIDADGGVICIGTVAGGAWADGARVTNRE